MVIILFTLTELPIDYYWSRSLNSGNSSSPWRVLSDGSSSLFNDALHSYGVASHTSDWSRSLNTGISFLPLSVGSGGILNIYWYGALDSHGVAAYVYYISMICSLTLSLLIFNPATP